MKVVGFFNNKGGVGKTTLVCNLASIFSEKRGLRTLVIDCDPQCNATLLILGEQRAIELYWSEHGNTKERRSTLYDAVRPFTSGVAEVNIHIAPIPAAENRFQVDLIPCHPRVSLIEDRLGQYWRDGVGGDIGGLRASNWSHTLLSAFSDRYDVAFLDLGPSLGALNRSALLGADYFVTPMGADVFSIMGLRNIKEWLKEWVVKYERGFGLARESDEEELNRYSLRRSADIRNGFAGYTVQAYAAKYAGRQTKAFDRLIEVFPSEVRKNLGEFQGARTDAMCALGEIPNMYSLIPLAQYAAAPISALGASDGILGAHYLQKQKYSDILQTTASALARNIELGETE